MRTHSICDPCIRMVIFEQDDMQIYAPGVAYPVLTRYQLGVCSVLVINSLYLAQIAQNNIFAQKSLLLVTCLNELCI